MPEHQKDPLLQLLDLSMADIEQGRTYSLEEIHSGDLLRHDVLAAKKVKYARTSRYPQSHQGSATGRH